MRRPTGVDGVVALTVGHLVALVYETLDAKGGTYTEADFDAMYNEVIDRLVATKD